ncbi:MAG: hypothetical protein R3F54_29380 [Alphaproteobacteria bacterium]
MMKTLVLICALGVPRADCSVDTAMSVVQGPDAGNLAQCGFLGQAYLASTAIANYLDGEHYMKILCTSGERMRAESTPQHEKKPVTATAMR